MADGCGAAWDILYSFVPAMAFKALILLGIPDILAKAGGDAALTAQEIADQLPSKCPDLDCLSRILRFLAVKGVLTFSHSVENVEETQYRYGLTDAARFFIVHDNPRTLSPFLLLLLEEMCQASWHRLYLSVLDGGHAFEKAYGEDLWTWLGHNTRMRDLFNAGMISVDGSIMQMIFEFYDGFKHVHSLVDIGGCSGQSLLHIVKAFPHIQGINFDLPDVIANAPSIPGVQHIGGDMFESVPSADAIHMKTVLHDWDDEHCRQILWNCHEAMPAHGRLIITEMVIDDTNLCNPIEQLKLAQDLSLLAGTCKGRERTAEQWKRLLCSAGFPRVEIHGLKSLYSVIEAFKA